jgi:DAK2 domain fusion protein YloV
LGAVSERPRRVHDQCDGRQLLDLFATATAWLAAHAAEVDALNVYPVPDGDTGSNMSQTMRSALAEAEARQDMDAGGIAASLAHGALMGARGNSGVILSQLLRGIARMFDGKRTFGPSDVAAALQEASATAYRAVAKPVEGTVLSVARVAAEHAMTAAHERQDFQHVLGTAVSAGRVALRETRNQLPVLKQAGVVDAGGQGYLLLLEGALRHVQGYRDVPLAGRPERLNAARAAASEHAQVAHHGGGLGYCTEFLLIGSGLSEHQLRGEIEALGDSLLVVGDSEVLRVHIHTEDPGRALSAATLLGRLQMVKVQDMQAQHEQFAHEVPSPPPATTAGDKLPIGCVAVSSGAGFEEVFANMGAVVVPGGQTINPSTQQILDAIESCCQSAVAVLPNNHNVIATAQQAATLSHKQVEVLPTKTMPEGVAAVLAIRFDEDTGQVLEEMRAAAAAVRTIEVTTAVREADLEGLHVRKGDILGILDGTLTVAGTDTASVITDLLDTIGVGDSHVLTLYAGEEVSNEDQSLMLTTISRRYPMVLVEGARGGQPHYQYIVSVE